MKVFIEGVGDRSVGIFPAGTTLEDICIEFQDKDEREGCRKLLAECFGQLWDDKVNIIFEDENEDAPYEADQSPHQVAVQPQVLDGKLHFVAYSVEGNYQTVLDIVQLENPLDAILHFNGGGKLTVTGILGQDRQPIDIGELGISEVAEIEIQKLGKYLLAAEAKRQGFIPYMGPTHPSKEHRIQNTEALFKALQNRGGNQPTMIDYNDEANIPVLEYGQVRLAYDCTGFTSSYITHDKHTHWLHNASLLETIEFLDTYAFPAEAG